MSSKWTKNDIPDQTGRTAIVTGANSGIGYDAALVLAEKGATVVLACRNLDKAHAAANEINSSGAPGEAIVMQLDLADLDSVRGFSDAIHSRFDKLNILINNAGVMIPPYGKTEQGFESQFGINHLGHFALTGLLLDLMLSTPDARVTTVSSKAHRYGTIGFQDLQWESRRYKPMHAYGQSKLANLLFTYELQRKLEQAHSTVIANAAHPGYTATNLQQHSRLAQIANLFFAQDSAMGALPTLYAATAPGAEGGAFYGPDRFMDLRGHPQRVGSNKKSHDQDVAARLWRVSEELTGVSYNFAPQQADTDTKPEPVVA